MRTWMLFVEFSFNSSSFRKFWLFIILTRLSILKLVSHRPTLPFNISNPPDPIRCLKNLPESDPTRRVGAGCSSLVDTSKEWMINFSIAMFQSSYEVIVVAIVFWRSTAVIERDFSSEMMCITSSDRLFPCEKSSVLKRTLQEICGNEHRGFQEHFWWVSATSSGTLFMLVKRPLFICRIRQVRHRMEWSSNVEMDPVFQPVNNWTKILRGFQSICKELFTSRSSPHHVYRRRSSKANRCYRVASIDTARQSSPQWWVIEWSRNWKW